MIHLAVALHYVNIKMFAEVCLGVRAPASRLQTTPSHLGRHASTAGFPKAAVTLYTSQSGNNSASKRAASAIPGPPAQVFKPRLSSRRSPFFSPLQTSPPSPHSFLTSTLPTFFSSPLSTWTLHGFVDPIPLTLILLHHPILPSQDFIIMTLPPSSHPSWLPSSVDWYTPQPTSTP